MASGKARAENTYIEEDEGEQFITEDDVAAIEPEDDDHPMDDDDDDEMDDQIERLPGDGEPSGPDNSLLNFTNHNASVFAVDVHPTEALAVSGGEDDLGYIWDITDGEVIVKLTGHSDSVSAVGWSRDGEMVASGGMDGKVRVWRRVGKENYKTWEFLTELQGPDEVVFLRWHPKGNVLLAGGQDSTLWLWQLPSGNTMQVFVGHTGPLTTGDFTPDGKRIITGDADGTLLFWDPRTSSPLWKLNASDARFDLDGITSVAVNQASTLAVVGGAAGGVRVINLAKGEIVAALAGQTEAESVEAITFVEVAGSSTGAGVAVTGATDGKICVWDLATMRLRTALKHEDAVTSLLTLPAPKAHLFVSASADKSLRTWDARTGALVQSHTGHRGPILGASLGLGGSVVVSAGDDGACLVYTTEPEEED